jgi:hypothetical protein
MLSLSISMPNTADSDFIPQPQDDPLEQNATFEQKQAWFSRVDLLFRRNQLRNLSNKQLLNVLWVIQQNVSQRQTINYLESAAVQMAVINYIQQHRLTSIVLLLAILQVIEMLIQIYLAVVHH